MSIVLHTIVSYEPLISIYLYNSTIEIVILGLQCYWNEEARSYSESNQVAYVAKLKFKEKKTGHFFFAEEK